MRYVRFAKHINVVNLAEEPKRFPAGLQRDFLVHSQRGDESKFILVIQTDGSKFSLRKQGRILPDGVMAEEVSGSVNIGLWQRVVSKSCLSPGVDVECGRLTPVFVNESHFKVVVYNIRIFFDSRRNIGSQTSLFIVARYPGLPPAENSSDNAAYGSSKSKYLGPICLSLFGFVVFTFGYWGGLRGRCDIWIVVPCIVFGILAAVIGGI